LQASVERKGPKETAGTCLTPVAVGEIRNGCGEIIEVRVGVSIQGDGASSREGTRKLNKVARSHDFNANPKIQCTLPEASAPEGKQVQLAMLSKQRNTFVSECDYCP